MCTVALRDTGGILRTAVADITAEVEDMQQLIGNLGSIRRTVAPNSHATVLLMPSQEFMKCTLEVHPQIKNEELVREVEKVADVYARYQVQGTLQPSYRSLHLTGRNGARRLLWDALSLSTSSTRRLYISDGAYVTCSSATARSVTVFQDCVMCTLHTGQYGV